MFDLEKVGKRIALLRRERGYTGEALAEKLQVSSQAISKWENARCLPETSILPALAEALDCSIDSLLCPREFFVLEAVYTDGAAHIPVTQFVNGMVRDNALRIHVNEQFLGASLPEGRLKILTVKYQTSKGIFYSYALQNDSLILGQDSLQGSFLPGEAFPGKTASEETACYPEGGAFRIIGAYYGNEKEFSPAMQQVRHYEYFNWDRIPVNHETFPSSTGSDDLEYLTLIYLNEEGIHVISCPENEAVYYGNHRTGLYLADQSKCILKDIMKLSWGEGMDCPWAGALYAALRYMGEPYSYHQIMGMSGACWRICFVDVWDFSCTDALVAYDFATPLFKNLGYSFRMVDRVEKQERKAERLAVMKDIQKGRPVLAINLRVAAEWGVITGYTENGSRFLCRTYFDSEVFDRLEQEDRRMVFEDNGGYLYNDFWPFLLIHFGEKRKAPSSLEALKLSLKTFTASFYAGVERGYHQGKDAYEAWMRGLAEDSSFQIETDREKVLRRLCVNDSMLCCLVDARRAATSYLRENAVLLPRKGGKYLEEMAAGCQKIADLISEFRERVCCSSTSSIEYNMLTAFGVDAPKYRREQIQLLEQALALDEKNCQIAQSILEMPDLSD